MPHTHLLYFFFLFFLLLFFFTENTEPVASFSRNTPGHFNKLNRQVERETSHGRYTHCEAGGIVGNGGPKRTSPYSRAKFRELLLLRVNSTLVYCSLLLPWQTKRRSFYCCKASCPNKCSQEDYDDERKEKWHYRESDIIPILHYFAFNSQMCRLE